MQRRKSGRRSLSESKIAAIHRTYLTTAGNCTKTGQRHGVHRHTVASMASRGEWAADLAESRRRRAARTVRSIAESQAKTIAMLDRYLDQQERYGIRKQIHRAKGIIVGFDVRGVAEATKLRQLLTGQPTDRSESRDWMDHATPEQLREYAAQLLRRVGRKHAESADPGE